MRKALAAAVSFFLLGACGGEGGSATPAAPTPVAPVLNGSTDLVYVGQTVGFTATGTGIKWGGDAPSVATVDQTTGVVTGVSTGRVTIWAENGGGRATRLLRVLPSYNGSWYGSYALKDCQSSGDFALGGFCGSFYSGQILNMGFTIAQNRDQVTGTFTLGTLQGVLTAGVVNEDGSLPLTGGIEQGNTAVVLQNMRAESPSPGTMKGDFDQVWSSTSLSGTGRLICEIRDVTRTSGAPTLMFLSQPETAAAPTLEDMVRAVLRRR